MQVMKMRIISLHMFGYIVSGLLFMAFSFFVYSILVSLYFISYVVCYITYHTTHHIRYILSYLLRSLLFLTILYISFDAFNTAYRSFMH